MVFPVVGGDGKPTGYDIENSLRFNSADNAYLNRTPSSEGNKRTYTLSFWAKITAEYGTDTSTNNFFTARNSGGYTSGIQQISGGHIQAFIYSDTGGEGYKLRLVTNAAYYDPAAWYHFVLAVDTTQGTASNRAKLYVNGSQVSSFSTETYPDQNFDSHINDDVPHYMGNKDGSNDDYEGHLAEFYLIDGTQYAASNFGETDDNGVWIPKETTGLSFGTNGFFMEFQQTGTSANSSGKGADTSGQDNHYDDNNMTAEDITVDTPTNNFATLNPLNIRQGIGTTFQEGNCQVKSATSGSSTAGAFSTIAGLKSGKWYAEFKPTVVGTNATMRFGIEDTDFNAADGLCNVAASAYASNGNKGRNATDTSHGDSYDDDDIIGVAVDLDNGAIYFSKNGTWQNSSDPESGSSKTGAAYTDILTILPTGGYMFAFNFVYNNSQQEIIQANFGNPIFSISSGNSDGNGYGNFEYAVPSGYYALCTKNLAEFG